jgi:hypothetical protein
MSKFVQFVDSQIDFALSFFAPDAESVARMPQNFCFSGSLLANQTTQFSASRRNRGLKFRKSRIQKRVTSDSILIFDGAIAHQLCIHEKSPDAFLLRAFNHD